MDEFDFNLPPVTADEDDEFSFDLPGTAAQEPAPEPVEESAGSQYNDRMYDGLSEEEAKAKYEAIIAHDTEYVEKEWNPKIPFTDISISTDVSGEVKTPHDPNIQLSTYRPIAESPLGLLLPDDLIEIDRAYHVDPETGKRTIIPRPTTNIVDRWFQYLAYGGEETLGDMAQTGAALVDEQLGTDTLNSSAIKALDADINTSKFDNALIADGVTAVLGGGAGVKGINALLKHGPAVFAWLNRYQRTLRVGKLALQGAGANAVISAGIDQNEDQLLFGENALIKLGDMDQYADLGESEQAELLEHRMEAFLDGALVGIGATGAANGAVLVGNMLWRQMLQPTLRGLSTKGVEKTVAEDINRVLNNIGPTTSQKERARLSAELADIVERNKKLLTEGLVDVNGDPLPVGPLELLSMDPKVSPEMLQEISSILKSADGRSDYPKTTARLRVADSARDDAINQGADEFVGENFSEMANGVFDQTSDILTNQSNRALDEAATLDEVTRRGLSNKVEQALQDFAKDPRYGEILKKLDARDASQLNESLAIGSRDGILKALDSAYARMKTAKNQKYQAVQDGDIDTNKLYDFFDAETLNAFSNAVRSIGKDQTYSRFSRIVDVLEKEIASGDISNSEARAKFAAAVKTHIPDYGTLYKDIRSEVSQMAALLMDGTPGDKAAAVHLRRFASFIQDDMLEGIKKTNPELAEAATEARRYFKDEFAPTWRGTDQPLSKFADLHDATVSRTSTDDTLNAAMGQGSRFDEASFQAKGVKIVDDAIKRTDAMTPQTLKKALENSDAQNAELIADHYIISALEETANKGYTNLADKLKPYQDILKKHYPPKFEKINKLLKTLQEREAVGMEAPDVAALVAQAKTDIESQAFMKHFQKFAQGRYKKRDGNDAFIEMLGDSKGKLFAIDEVKEMLASIEKLPKHEGEIVTKGLRGAYLRLFRDTVQELDKSIGGTHAVKSRSAAKVLDNHSSLLRMGKEIFSDEPEYLEILEVLTNHSHHVQNLRMAKVFPGHSETAIRTEAYRGLDKLIHITLGPLNRTATRTRALSKMIYEAKDPESIYARARDEILSNPDAFIRAMRNNDEMAEERMKMVQGWLKVGTVRTDWWDSRTREEQETLQNSPELERHRQRQNTR